MGLPGYIVTGVPLSRVRSSGGSGKNNSCSLGKPSLEDSGEPPWYADDQNLDTALSESGITDGPRGLEILRCVEQQLSERKNRTKEEGHIERCC